MSSTFSGDETTPFFGFLGGAAALVLFSCMGAVYGMGSAPSMGVMRPKLVMKSIVPVVMAGVLGIYGLIIVVIISTGINPKAKSYYLFDGYAHLSSRLACGLAGLATAVGLGVSGIKVGDIVACAGSSMGAYAEEQILPALKVVVVPPSIDPIVAASVMVKNDSSVSSPQML
ncbi:V-type proton ATPase 16 kDa proteolipid subunit-like [Salvia miltiorrhiza]|uniref:V-type proton ATPase 16 kDa proteolipid subunit-like n=1 Tax=Salvia miltiorrhiza TaxID=226208 RepID=UPI0025AD0F6E|nr:V-type proton ATPase 16 kDa proteolipid subunit-like [Salvia miltiorrhiza]